ncbi:MAG TPA: hypothetical protein VKN99_03135 [Polyangia bacterium]|nr:hypothetical protein [Polyangia bacterium]
MLALDWDRLETPVDALDEPEPTLAAPSAAVVRLTYRRINAFLGHFLGRMRRGETILCEAPPGCAPGDLLDVELAVAEEPPFILHAQVVETYLGQAELRFVHGPMTDRAVGPLLARALGQRHARALLNPPAASSDR